MEVKRNVASLLVQPPSPEFGSSWLLDNMKVHVDNKSIIFNVHGTFFFNIPPMQWNARSGIQLV